jgi:heterodisulfide reductase subunit A-like polyferredoxin
VRYRQSRLVARADYTAATDPARCTGCGECVGRCPFDARKIVEGSLHEHLDRCYGCGLCVSACPAEAIELKSQLVKS